MPKIPKQEFTRVTIDSTTYYQLTELAFDNRISRAEYIRRFIRSQFVIEGEFMQVHNMLESKGEGQGYKTGNIKLIRVRANEIEVLKQNREVLKYKLVEGEGNDNQVASKV